MWNGKSNHFAKGRLKPGELNKTEEKYRQHLEGRMLLGEIVWYRFEGFTLRLADNTRYTGDFAVMRSDGSLEIHEVKGRTMKTRSDGTKVEAAYTMDDAKMKIKIAADMFPLRFVMVFPSKRGDWVEQSFSGDEK